MLQIRTALTTSIWGERGGSVRWVKFTFDYLQLFAKTLIRFDNRKHTCMPMFFEPLQR